MIVQDTTRTAEYVLQSDRELPKEQQTIFLIGTLTKRQFIDALKIVGKYQEGQQITDVATFLSDIDDVIKLGLRGWSNLKDSRGQEITFDLNRLDELFTPIDLQELVLAIINVNTLGGRDRKNSTSRQAS